MSFLKTKIEFLKGVGPAKAQVLQKEISIFTFGDLLTHYPFRYVDKTKFHRISELSDESDAVQLRGILRQMNVQGDGRKKRLVARFRDASGSVDLVWFKGATWLQDKLQLGGEYIVYGKVNAFKSYLSIPHPEIELVTEANTTKASTFAPVYPSTEKLGAKSLDAKGLRRLIKVLLNKMQPADITETLPDYLLKKLKLPTKFQALRWIHFPKTQEELEAARRRLKFEELFFLQIRLLMLRRNRKDNLKGFVFSTIGDYFNGFFNNALPFNLTNAQKRVLKEIRKDMGTGEQMNRLLQGDVGSGKTVVGLMTMLMALDNGFQACLLAPTEILAQQHFTGIGDYLKDMDVEIGFLSGSVKGKKRKLLLEKLAEGKIDILIGTHAILEDPVQFKNLGLAITDEQHRFGVKQRARLWRKSIDCPPHVLVMTATPIPRTLAMTLYGDLDVSVIDELPPGRKPVKTIHRTDSGRLRVQGFMKQQIAEGRQVYVVYPLIEENEKLDLLALEQGYETLLREFPMPEFQISVLHGRMKPKDKDFEMQRFVKGDTQIMVATTVIEVGVNVPNATVMIIENTERFGLSQLHQLRGRVGRGAAESYCILMSSYKLSKDSRERIQTMVNTNNGFEIAEADLRLRGPGNIEGTQQSGLISFKMADLSKDGQMLKVAREIAARILEDDAQFERPEHLPIKLFMEEYERKHKGWSRIS